jgi:hypothetical protein
LLGLLRRWRFLEGGLQLGKGFLRASQISGLQGLSDGSEICFAVRFQVGVPAGERPSLGQSLNGVVFLLRGSQVPGLEGFAESLLIGTARLKILLQLVVNRSRGY